MKNVNRVPKKQWARWSLTARRVFNEVNGFMLDNQWLMLHPKSPQPNKEHYKTIAWNAAWIAADAVDESVPTEIVTKVKRKKAK